MIITDQKKLKINTTTILSTDHSTDNTTILLLIDNDIHVKSTVFNLLKLKFQNQQAGKKLWLQRRESTDYDYIPIEFSKDLHFVTSFIKRMNENEDKDSNYFHYSWYRHDYFDILSDELKMESDIELSTEISKSFINGIIELDVSQIKRMTRIFSESDETKSIEIICTIANTIYGDIRQYIVSPFIDKLSTGEEFLLKCISLNHNVFKFISDKVQRNGQYDLELITKCVTVNGLVLQHVDSKCSIFSDKQLIMKAFQSMIKSGRPPGATADNISLFNKLSANLKNDREIILKAIECRIPVLEFINSFGLCLQYAPPHFKKDIEIVNEAIKQNPFVIQHLNITSMDCKNSLLNAVELMHIQYESGFGGYGDVLKSINDVDIAMKLIETIPHSIHSLNRNFRNNCQELTFKSTLLHNGYWMNHSEDAFQERIIHAYHSAKIDSKYSEINYYRNVNKSNLWKDLKWRKWE